MQALARVEAVERLVEHEDLRVVHEGGGHLHPLAVALREGAHRATVCPSSSSTISRARAAASIGSGTSQEAGGGRDELGRGERLEEALLLGHEADAPEEVEVLAGVAARAPAPGPATAGPARTSSRSTVDLPAPFGPSSAVTPGPTGEADVGDGHHVAEPLRHVVELDHGCRRHGRGRWPGVAGEPRSGSPRHHDAGGSATRSTPKPRAIQPRLTIHSSVVPVSRSVAGLAVDPLDELERRADRG